MSARRGLSASILFNQYDLSQYLKQAEPSLDIELLEATPFQAPGGDKVFITGFKDGKLSLEGFFQSDNVNQAAIDDVFNSVIGGTAKQIVTVSPEGANLAGNRSFLIDADTTKYMVSNPAMGLIMSSAEVQSSSGLGYGVILHPLTAETTSGNGAGVDNGLATAKGGAGHIHVPAFAGTTPSLAVKIQHSVDGSAWVDLITFTTVTGKTSERIEVAGMINRFTRAIRTIGGTGGPSFTYAVAFARF